MEAIKEYDFCDEKIEARYLVYQDQEIIVWIDTEYDVDWKSCKEISSAMEKPLHRTKALAAKVESIPNKHHSVEVVICFKRMLGEAIVCALKDDINGAENAIKRAEEYISLRNSEVSRIWTLKCNVFMIVVEIVVLHLLWLGRDYFDSSFGINARNIMLCFLVGSLGSAASIIMRIGKHKTSLESGQSLHYLETISRHFVGGLSGCLLYSLVQSGYILSVFKNSTSLLNVFGIALIGGCSERIIPLMLSKIESNKPKEV